MLHAATFVLSFLLAFLVFLTHGNTHGNTRSNTHGNRRNHFPLPIPVEWTTGEWVEDTSATLSRDLDKDLKFYYRYPAIDKDWFVPTLRTNTSNKKYLKWRWAPASGVKKSNSSLGFLNKKSINNSSNSIMKDSNLLSSKANISRVPPLISLSRREIFACLKERTMTYYGDSLSRQMYLSLGGMLFQMDGMGNNSLGNNGAIVINDKLDPGTTNSNWIPHRLDFHHTPITSEFRRKGGTEVVHTAWVHSNYWVDMTIGGPDIFYLHPQTANPHLRTLCEKSTERDVIVLAMAHWWTMVQHWNKVFFVNFTQYPDLKLEGHEVSDKEQMLTIYSEVVKTTMNFLVTHFKGIVVWRTSSSAQNDCVNGNTITPLDKSIQYNNIGEMNEILKNHVHPVVRNHKKHLLLDVADLSLRRKDALAGAIYDCLHWCLPGVPDLWNMIMLNSICVHQK